ncbi:MAG: SCP2 domain-containing protein [Thiobacillaceae bacterium]
MNVLTPLALRAINHLVMQNPGAQDALQHHEGKTVGLQSGLFNVVLAITADGAFSDAATPTPNATIRLDPALIVNLPFVGKAAFKSVETEGDADLLADVSRIFQTLEWDLEADLATGLGGIVAHRLVASGRTLRDWVEQTGAASAATLAEYVTEEQHVLASRMQIDQFCQEVDVLKDAVARLQTRLYRLERTR